MKKISIYCFSFLFLFLFVKAGCSPSDDDVDLPAPNSDQYITWNFGSNRGQLTAPKDSFMVFNQYGPTEFYVMNSSSQVYGSFDGTRTGNYPLQLTLLVNGKYYIHTSALQVSVTAYGNTGGYISGSYSGKVKDSTSAGTYDINGLFKIKNQ